MLLVLLLGMTANNSLKKAAKLYKNENAEIRKRGERAVAAAKLEAEMVQLSGSDPSGSDEKDTLLPAPSAPSDPELQKILDEDYERDLESKKQERKEARILAAKQAGLAKRRQKMDQQLHEEQVRLNYIEFFPHSQQRSLHFTFLFSLAHSLTHPPPPHPDKLPGRAGEGRPNGILPATRKK